MIGLRCASRLVQHSPRERGLGLSTCACQTPPPTQQPALAICACQPFAIKALTITGFVNPYLFTAFDLPARLG